MADVVLTENVNLIDRDGEGFYQYDEYRVTVTDRPGLDQSVVDNFPAWILAATSPAPALEDRVALVETDVDDIVTVLAALEGVSL